MTDRHKLIKVYYSRFAGQARHTLKELVDMDINELARWAFSNNISEG